MKESVTSFRTYLGAFFALMLLLVVTVGAAYINFGALNLPISLSISILKTLVIILFFMEVKKGSALTWILAGAGFFWLAIMLSLVMCDYLTRNL